MTSHIIESVEEFHELVQNNQCPPQPIIQLSDTFTHNHAELLLTTLNHNNCPSNITIILEIENKSLDVETMKTIANCLKSRSNNLTIKFIALKLPEDGKQLLMEYLGKALQSGKCPAGRSLHFDSFLLTGDNVEPITNAIQSNNFPKYTSLNFWGNNTRDQSFDIKIPMHFANAIEKAEHLKNFSLSFEGNGINYNIASPLIAILNSNKCPEGFYLDFSCNTLGAMGAKEIFTLFETGQYAPKFSLCLSENELGNLGALCLATAINKQKCQCSFELHLQLNNFGVKGAECLAGALNNLPPESLLGLENNNIGDQGMRHIAQAIQHRNYQKGTTLLLGNNKITDEGLGYLIEALQSSNDLPKITLGIDNHGLDEVDKNQFSTPKKQELINFLQSGYCSTEVTILGYPSFASLVKEVTTSRLVSKLFHKPTINQTATTSNSHSAPSNSL